MDRQGQLKVTVDRNITAEGLKVLKIAFGDALDAAIANAEGEERGTV